MTTISLGKLANSNLGTKVPIDPAIPLILESNRVQRTKWGMSYGDFGAKDAWCTLRFVELFAERIAALGHDPAEWIISWPERGSGCFLDDTWVLNNVFDVKGMKGLLIEIASEIMDKHPYMFAAKDLRMHKNQTYREYQGYAAKSRTSYSHYWFKAVGSSFLENVREVKQHEIDKLWQDWGVQTKQWPLPGCNPGQLISNYREGRVDYAPFIAGDIAEVRDDCGHHKRYWRDKPRETMARFSTLILRPETIALLRRHEKAQEKKGSDAYEIRIESAQYVLDIPQISHTFDISGGKNLTQEQMRNELQDLMTDNVMKLLYETFLKVLESTSVSINGKEIPGSLFSKMVDPKTKVDWDSSERQVRHSFGYTVSNLTKVVNKLEGKMTEGKIVELLTKDDVVSRWAGQILVRNDQNEIKAKMQTHPSNDTTNDGDPAISS